MKRTLIIVFTFLLPVAAFSQTFDSRVLAHRAGRADFEENVLQSFEKCYAAGMHSFETDIRLTADGVLVISHDADMKRMYDRSGIVEEMTLAELRTFRTPQGSTIMTLDELLAFFKDKEDLYVEFELKTSKDDPHYPVEVLEKYCDEVYAKVMAAKPADATFIISSFDYRALRYLAVKHPGEDSFMLIHGDPVNDKTMALVLALGVKRMAVTLNGTSRRFVKEAHEKGIKMNLWPGSGVEDFMLAASLGADYICTDYPLEIMDFVKSNTDLWKGISW